MSFNTELVSNDSKKYLIYNVDNNPTSIYEADLSAITGDRCKLTTIEYTGTNPTKMKREDSTWDSSYDI